MKHIKNCYLNSFSDYRPCLTSATRACHVSMFLITWKVETSWASLSLLSWDSNQIGSTINNLTYKHKWNESQLIAIKTPPRVVIRTQFIIIRNLIELVEIRTLLISTRHGDFVIIVLEKEGEWRREREKGEKDRHRQTQRQTSREKKIDGWRNREGDSERKQRE